MEEYKKEFIRFMVQSQVLTFGDFTTKSGRRTPYFVNTGRYRTGAQMNELGRYYADAILASGIEFDLLFGPAYKGIPLVVACSMELARRGQDVPFCFDRKEAKDHGEGGRLVGQSPSDGDRVLIVEDVTTAGTSISQDVPFCFDRKEAKDHGEGGRLVGQSPSDGDRVLIVEDVTTAGTSISQTVPILQAAAKVKLAGLIVSVDRMERADTGEGAPALSALSKVGAQYSMPTLAIVTVDEIMGELRGQEMDGRVVLTEALHAQMVAYRTQYGV